MTGLQTKPEISRRRRVLLADDEPLACERLRMMLDLQPQYEVVAESGDGAAAVEAIIAHAPEIVFLDIKMPGMDGLEVVAALQELPAPPVVIFVTAFDSHALRAFEVGAVDYLLKPFDISRFEQALARAEARLGRPAATVVEAALRTFLETLPAGRPYPERFLVRGPKHLYFVRTQDIEWADAQGNYVRLHVAGRAHFVRHTMKAFADRLPPDRFVRVHRSIVLHVDHIQRLDPHAHGEYVITLLDGTRVTSSRSYSEGLRALLR